MQWKETEERAQELSGRVIECGRPSRAITFAALYQEGQADPAVLYFAGARQFTQRTFPRTGNWVMWGNAARIHPENQTRSEDGEAEEANIIAFETKDAALEFYNVCVKLLLEEQHMHRQIDKLNKMMQENAGMQALVNAISDMFEAPVTVMDRSLDFIAYSQNRRITDPTLQNELERGHLDSRISKRIYNSNYLAPADKRTETVKLDLAFEGTNVKTSNYLTVIYSRKNPIASMSVFPPSGKLTEIQQHMLPEIASILSLEMQKNSFYTSNRANLYLSLLTTIIQADPSTDLDDAKARLRIFGYDLRPRLQFLHVDASRVNYNAFEMSVLAHQLTRIVPNNIYMILESSIVMMTSFDGKEGVTKEVSNALVKAVTPTGVIIGVSDIGTDLAQARGLAEQAQRAIQTGTVVFPAWKVHHYRHLRMYDLARLLDERGDVRFYLYPPILMLHEHDEKTGSNLVETLFVYLVQFKNPEDVCERLHIHRNTLRYRLRKIREIMECDIESGPVIAQIFLTFAILRYQDRLSDFIHESWAEKSAELPDSAHSEL